MTNDDTDITVLEAMQITGWTKQWIYDLVRENKVKHSRRKIGGVNFIFIDRNSLTEYQEGRKVDGIND